MCERRREDRLRYLDSIQTASVMVLGCVVAFAHWQLLRASLWGVIRAPGGKYEFGADILIDDHPWFFWAMVALWVLLGPIYVVGTGIFMCLQRSDKF